MTLTALLVVVGVAAIAAGGWATVLVAVLLVAAGEWSDRAKVAP